MKGITLSYHFFNEVMYPLIKNEYPILLEKCAYGLIGEGSECYGYDDEISKDHDFSPLCCIFVPHNYYPECYPLVNEMLQKLPSNYNGYQLGLDNTNIMARRGLIDISCFLKKYLNSEDIPENLINWLMIPSHYLSTTVNGMIFLDNEGSFTKTRERLLKGYPLDVTLHKMAHSCIVIAQSGQYNYQRCLNRGELLASDIAKAQFTEHVMQLVYLLNNKYAPYYKWMQKGLLECPYGGKEIYDLLESLTISCTNEKIEIICNALYDLLNAKYPIPKGSGFFVEYAAYLQSMIENKNIKEISIWTL